MIASSGERQSTRRRVLFMAEAVTLAHVARPHVLANALSPNEFDVLFCADPRFDRLFGDRRYQHRPLTSIPSERFLQALAKGSPVYDLTSLEQYVQQDLAIIDEFRPHVIVGDFRLSLSVSARLRGVPYVGISNAYWSPNAAIRCPVPELPITKLLGHSLGQVAFDIARPIGFALHARPMNQLRKRHGLASLPADVRWAYIDADQVLFADWPELVPMRQSNPAHHFVGPITWSPAVPLPHWWNDLDPALPVVYVTFGSSGAASMLPLVTQCLDQLPITVVVATAGRMELKSDHPRLLVSDYLPGDEAARRAQLVICNGGSPTTHQSIAVGTPVLGIPSNLDQCLNMASIEAYGAGLMVRQHAVSSSLNKAVEGLLSDERFRHTALTLARADVEPVPEFIARLLGGPISAK